MRFQALAKVVRAHVNRSKDAAESAGPDRPIGMHGHRGMHMAAREVVMAAMNADELKALALEKANHLFAAESWELSHGQARSSPNQVDGTWDG